MTVGDARHLNRGENSVDAVLLLGLLYHLIERSDRLTALREAHRILKSGGLIFAVGISRFASTLEGLFSGYLDDPEFVAIVQQDLVDGQHRNRNNHPAYFTTAFLHHPEELKAEVEEAGFDFESILAIEGAETEPSILGASAHILAVAKKATIS